MKRLENKIEKYFESMSKESDRGCILVAASMLDHQLENIIKKTLLSNVKGRKNKVNKSLFEINGPFSSFWSKTQFLYAIGILKRDDYYDLEIIRKIRNIVAHNFDVAGFSDKRITDRSEKLRAADKAVKHMPKTKTKNIKVAKVKKTKISKNNYKAQMERMRFSLSASFIGGVLSEHGTEFAALALSLRLMNESQKQLLKNK
ncbi:MAG: hypothetical protein IIB40_08715 [Candidatus Marinimicrobia bacterium]|nr:hypothetical protein [Candidatus Neomarinimicrobiota bacterium]